MALPEGTSMKEINLPAGAMITITMAPHTAPKPLPSVAECSTSFSVAGTITPDEGDTFRLLATGFDHQQAQRLKALKQRAGSLFHHFWI